MRRLIIPKPFKKIKVLSQQARAKIKPGLARLVAKGLKGIPTHASHLRIGKK